MDRAAGGQPGGLLSVSGWPGPALQAWCRAFGLSVAIRLGEDAVIVGGPRPSLAAAADEAVRQGAKVSLLDIDVASHTPAMRPASEALARSLAGAALRRPRWPLISNVTGDQLPDGADAAVACLSRQVSETVRWSDCLDAVQARRPTCVLEIGPGSALATLWNRRFPDCPARSADEFRSAAAIVDWVERQAR
jgi:[acyl-carrier-protein] S-malonyltransferase